MEVLGALGSAVLAVCFALGGWLWYSKVGLSRLPGRRSVDARADRSEQGTLFARWSGLSFFAICAVTCLVTSVRYASGDL